ncbi:hypothetical protein [Pseudokineococcus lusitanus]|uniref:YD repeat-containing protein n=1 Tax=Pseudokineococcus lusitanus TaxID=763993 RepID=A0A3N1GWL7_9ACTN|nr:hypothetical protein [Pseudokineococcus lusitanus]ROP34638.1 hypothetical protein EDC03_2454 [Pseudokineococcus lusitanus]
MTRRRATAVAVLAVAGLALGGAVPATAAPSARSVGAVPSAAADEAPLTNLDHLDFLLDEVSPPVLADHTTYRLAEEPVLLSPWTYADAPVAPGEPFRRVGGGTLDPATGDWTQGAYNADDITRAAVVYVRHWQQTGERSSRDSAYELLRLATYLQTTTGPDAGNVVLWMQPDGDLNPSAEPVELPDPSDSETSYWVARTLWALGEGYAAFAAGDAEDRAFAAFLRERLHLSLDAVQREDLSRYGETLVADGERVPAWLITDAADATAEAVVGLTAYAEAAPDDAEAREALGQLAVGVAAMGDPAVAGDRRSWPYGAVLPWARSTSQWHAWASFTPAALADAGDLLDDPALVRPAVADATSFTPTLLTGTGVVNAWAPAPTEVVQIAYGTDSRVQSLLAVAEATGRPGPRAVAGVTAAWYFGANTSGEPVYDPATGVTNDGVEADGRVNVNSGAESTIHGLLTMLALDAAPDVRAIATAGGDAGQVLERDGLTSVEGEAAAGGGRVVARDPAWTGESSWSGSASLRLDRGRTATWELPAADQPRSVEPVTWRGATGAARPARWAATGDGGTAAVLGTTPGRAVGAQGVTGAPGALLPEQLRRPLPAGATGLRARALTGPVDLDAVLLRPEVSRLVLAADDGGPGTTLLASAVAAPRTAAVEAGPGGAVATRYDAVGRLVGTTDVPAGGGDVVVPADGTVVVVAG